VQFGTAAEALAIAGLAFIITTVEGYWLTPSLTGRVAQINRVAIFAGLLFWTWLWGMPGMLLAVPMLMATKAVCDRIEDLQPIGRMLGD
jgi:predicted PurR-regulated permease PerM